MQLQRLADQWHSSTKSVQCAADLAGAGADSLSISCFIDRAGRHAS